MIGEKEMITVFKYEPYNMAYVYLENKLIMLGNYSDFYNGCHNITSIKNKKIKFNSLSDLTTKLKKEFNFKIKEVKLSTKQYNDPTLPFHI